MDKSCLFKRVIITLILLYVFFYIIELKPLIKIEKKMKINENNKMSINLILNKNKINGKYVLLYIYSQIV